MKSSTDDSNIRLNRSAAWSEVPIEELRDQFADPSPAFRPLQIIHGFDHQQDTGASPEEIADLLVDRGCGGAVVNVGWRDYLADEEQWALLGRGISLLRDRGLRIWLYDEDGYPSGSAGGQVLNGHPEYEACGLICVIEEVSASDSVEVSLPISASEWVYAMAIPDEEDGPRLDRAFPVSYCRRDPVSWTAPIGRWLLACFARKPLFEGTHASNNFYARRRYPNLMTPEAAERFCQLTHRAYGTRFPNEMGGDIEAIFTDEPSLLSAYHSPEEGVDLPPVIPWERGLPEYFEALKGYPIWSGLPGLFLDAPSAHQFRCDFYDVVGHRVAESFFRTIRNTCRELGIASTGHLLGEEFLSAQALYEGDHMTCLRELDIPGVDMLNADPVRIMNSELFLVPKMASSVAHMTGRDRAMSEHSDYSERRDDVALTMEERQAAVALQYALGINQIASYYPWRPGGLQIDPQGVLKKDSLGPEYRQWTDFVGRLEVMLAGGVHVCRVGVLYPISGVQAYLRPTAAGEPKPREAEPMIARIENCLIDTCRELLRGQWDFDLIDDQGLVEADVRAGGIRLGGESYRAIVMTTTPVLSVAALRRLTDFQKEGGLVIIVGDEPKEAAEVGVQAAFERAWDEFASGRPVRAASPKGAVAFLRERPQPDISLSPSCPSIIALHRRHSHRETFLFVNTSPVAVEFDAVFNASGKPSFWWPKTGLIEPIEEFDFGAHIVLAGFESVIVVWSELD